MSPTIDCRSFLACRFRLSILIFIIDCRCEKPPYQQINELCIKWCITPKRKSSDIIMMDIKHKSKIPQIECNTCGVELKPILKQDLGIWQITLLCLPIYNLFRKPINYLSVGFISITLKVTICNHVLWWMDVCVLTSCARRCIYCDNLLLV